MFFLFLFPATKMDEKIYSERVILKKDSVFVFIPLLVAGWCWWISPLLNDQMF